MTLLFAALLLASAPNSEPTADPFFEQGRVLEIEIAMDPHKWRELRTQTRYFGRIAAEGRRGGPFTSPYTWFPATVTVDGETHEQVGVRKKGFLGSLSTDKPGLKLRFDKFVKGQALGGVLERMTLNNSVQDHSHIAQCMTYHVFTRAGLPASRCNFARVAVNGQALGLYVHVEQIEHNVIPRWFEDDDGNLYEGAYSDFTPRSRGLFEKETNSKENDWSDIDAAVAALTTRDDRALAEIFDLDQFLKFWALEVLTGHEGGYAGSINDFHIYRERGGKFVFLPWGVDTTFDSVDQPWDDFENPQSVLAHGALANSLYHHPAWRAAYLATLRALLTDVWNEDHLLELADELATTVQANIPPAERMKAAADTERVRQFIRDRRSQILGELAHGPPVWPDTGYAPLWIGRFLHPARVLESRHVTAPGNEELRHNIPDLQVEIEGRMHRADFLSHYDRTGGLERWGYPTSEVMALDWGALTQFYQRGVVDFHNVGQGWIMERRLAWDYIGGGTDGAEDQGTESDLLNPHPGRVVGPWGHKVSNYAVDGTQTGFAEFFDRLGGVEVFGYPKTEARMDRDLSGRVRDPATEPGFIRQYFQAAVFEYHPGDPEPVKLSLLGDTLRDLLMGMPSPFRAAAPLEKGQVLNPWASWEYDRFGIYSSR